MLKRIKELKLSIRDKLITEVFYVVILLFPVYFPFKLRCILSGENLRT